MLSRSSQFRASGLVQEILCDVYSMAELSHIPYSPVGNGSMCFAGEARTHRSMARRSKVDSWKRRDEFPKEFVTLPGESYPSSALVDACYTLLLAPKSAAIK
jgi:hypothetical protein